MQMRNVSRIVACLLICGACASAQAQAPIPAQPQRPGGVVVPVQPPPGASPTQSKREPPFVARMGGPEAPAPWSSIRVWVQIERNLLDATPMRLSFALPAGVTLVQGEVEESVVDPTSRVVRREIELRLGERVPEEDVVVTVSQRGEGWGGHAEHRYHFGRPAPDVTPALRRGGPIDLGNGTIVRPVIVE